MTVERDGEQTLRTEANDGAQAMSMAIAELLRMRRLQAGDRMTVEASE